MNSMERLFTYLGLPVAEAYDKFHYWQYFQSLAEGFDKYNSITEGQYNSIVKHISKHLGIELKPYNMLVATHESKYKRKHKTNLKKQVTRVKHNYGILTDLSLWDLPYESESIVEIEVYPYSSTTLVTKVKGKLYRIPCPMGWSIKEAQVVRCRYKRTEYKGFLTRLDVEQ